MSLGQPRRREASASAAVRLPQAGGNRRCSSHGSSRLLPASWLAPCPPWGAVSSETIGIVNSINDAAAEGGRMPSRGCKGRRKTAAPQRVLPCGGGPLGGGSPLGGSGRFTRWRREGLNAVSSPSPEEAAGCGWHGAHFRLP